MNEAVRPNAWLPRVKYLLFGVVGLMMLMVLENNERFLINQHDPIWNHYQPFKWWLLPHGIAGALALFLGPLQFSDSFRKRFIRWHRIAGRFYVGAAMIAAPLGVYIQHTLGPPPLVTVTNVDAALLMFTTGMGLTMALMGNIQAHQQWMTRSYVVALVFLEVRCVQAVPWLSNMVDENSQADMWICLVFSLLVADLILQGGEMMKRRSMPKQSTAALAR